MLILITAIGVQAQMSLNWSQNYQQTATPGFSNESRKIAVDPSGNIYILADVTSDYDPAGVQVTTTQNYTVLLKYDINGNFIVSRQIAVGSHLVTGFNNKSAFGLEVDQAGNIYVGCNVFNPNTNYNIAITKYNPSLIRLWGYTYNPAGNEFGLDLKVAPTGKAFALIKSLTGGTTYKIIAADTTSPTGTADFHVFANTTEVVNSMVVNQNEEVYVTGSQLQAGFNTIMTAAIGSSGSLKWKRFYNGGSSNRDDSGNKIVKGPGQELYVLGTSDRGTPFGLDPIVLKYFSGNGRLSWATFLDHDQTDNYGVTINTFNSGLVFVGSTSGIEVLVDRLETTRGQHTGRRVYAPTPAADYISIDSVSVADIQASPFDNVYLSGTIYATDLNNDDFVASWLAKFIPNTGRVPLDQALKLEYEIPAEGTFNKSFEAADFVIDFNNAKLHNLVSTFSTFTTHNDENVQINSYDLPLQFRSSSNLHQSNSSIIVYPNPANGFFNITGDIKPDSEIILSDLTGRTVAAFVSSGNMNTFSTENIAPGYYHLSIPSTDGTLNRTIIIK
jgi:hypothetical protein